MNSRKTLAQRALAAAAASVSLSSPAVALADTTDARCDIYPKGSNRASAVIPCKFSQRQGYVSIDRSDGVRHELSPTGSRPGNYADERGRPAFRKSGLGKRGLIFQLADESIHVYWSTAGLAEKQPASKAPTPPAAASPSAPAANWSAIAKPGEPFRAMLSLQGIGFRLASANNASVNRLEIVPSGLQAENSPVSREIDGTVTGAEVADLNADGSPELYVYVVSAGSGSYGSLVAYAANRRKSLSEIYLPPIAEDPKLAKGYMGHDQFAVVENTLVRRFPIYREGDPNARPTGGTRQLQYKLTPGEAGWILTLERTIEY